MKAILLFILFIVCCFCSAISQSDKDLHSIIQSVSTDKIHSYVNEMVDPKYKGRLAGSPEYMDVAHWAADLMKEWGIDPLGDNGSYFQYFNRSWCYVIDEGHVILYNGNETLVLKVKDEYYPGANSFNGTVKARLVFAGHGITAPELKYDDYENIDVKGKIVLIAGDVPYKGKNSDTTALWTFYNSHRYKYTNAYEHGAAGVLLVDMMASPGTPHYDNFYYASVSSNVSQYIFETMNLHYDSVTSGISKTMLPSSFETGFQAEIHSETECFQEGPTANVIGYIEGNDPELKDEYIIIGAHLDGQGSLGFLLPGALDNASGVACVLETARALAKMKGNMKRSVMIILFGGEECGLLGSLWYADHPFIPLENIVMMFNLDMVGNGTGLAAWGAQSYPDFLKHFENNNLEYIHRNFKSSENKPVQGRPRTDGLVFLMHDIPTIHFGITDREFPVYYHSYKDTDNLLSYKTMEDAAKLLFLAVFGIANDINLHSVHNEK